MLNVSQQLQLLETHFPNKELIYIEDAVQFIEDIVNTKVKQELIMNYLKSKGYKQIERKQPTEKQTIPKADEFDFDLDDFLESNKDVEVHAKIPAKKSSYESNSEMIQSYQSDQDDRMRADIVVQNLRLVHKEASKLQNWMKHKLSYDDLVQEGIFGLLKAIERFDGSLGNQFSTYAIWWIRQAIFRAICNTGSTVRIPVHMIELVNKMRKMERQSMNNEDKINIDFVCEALNITIEKYEQIKQVESNFFQITSLNGVVSEEDGDTELLEFISNDHVNLLGIDMSDYQDPYLSIERIDEYDKLYKALDGLKEREKDIIIERFGFKDGENKTLEEVGKKYGVTRERIRQIEAKAMKRLRYRIRKKDWISA